MNVKENGDQSTKKELRTCQLQIGTCHGCLGFPGLLHPEPLSLWQSTADPNVHKKCSNTVLPQSLGPGVHKVCLSPLNDWQECGLILNVNSPLLPSYWGFSFAL